MKTAIRHPYSAMTYELAGNNRVCVRDGNRSGIFDRSGSWIEGDIKSADPCLCRWIASDWHMNERRRVWGKAFK